MGSSSINPNLQEEEEEKKDPRDLLPPGFVIRGEGPPPTTGSDEQVDPRSLLPEGFQVRSQLPTERQRIQQRPGQSAFPSFKEFATEEGPEMVGSVAGEAMGFGIGQMTPMIPWVDEAALSVLGGGVGAVAGRASSQIAEGDFDFTELVRAFNRGSASTKFGQAVSGLANKVLNFSASKVPAEALDAELTLARFFPKNENVRLLPHEATASRLVDILGNATESAIIGGGFLKRFKGPRNEAIRSFFDDAATAVTEVLPREDLGKTIQLMLKANLNEAEIPAKIVRNKIEDFFKRNTQSIGVGQKPLSIAPIQKYLRDHAIFDFTFGDLGKGFLKTMLDNEPELTVEQAFALRTSLRELADTMRYQKTGKQTIRLVEEARNMLDKEMSQFFRQVDPQIDEYFRAANKRFYESREQFKPVFLDRLIRKLDEQEIAPEVFIDSLLKNNNPSEIRQIKKALTPFGEKEPLPAWNLFQARYTARLLGEAIEKDSGYILGSSLKDLLEGRGLANVRGIDPNSLKTVLGSKEAFQDMKRLANALTVMQRKQADGTGSMFMQLVQAPAAFKLMQGVVAGGLAATGRLGESSFIILGPAAVGMLFQSPLGRKLLIKGAKLPAGSQEAASTASRIVLLLDKARRAREKLHQMESEEEMERSFTAEELMNFRQP